MSSSMIISEFLPAKPNRLRDYAAQMGVRLFGTV
jgi:hypothetical protein